MLLCHRLKMYLDYRVSQFISVDHKFIILDDWWNFLNQKLRILSIIWLCRIAVLTYGIAIFLLNSLFVSLQYRALAIKSYIIPVRAYPLFTHCSNYLTTRAMRQAVQSLMLRSLWLNGAKIPFKPTRSQTLFRPFSSEAQTIHLSGTIHSPPKHSEAQPESTPKIILLHGVWGRSHSIA
jgi:hypothetical protein